MLDGDHCYTEKYIMNGSQEMQILRNHSTGQGTGRSHQKGLKKSESELQSIWGKNVPIRKTILIFQ